ncbi:MAG: hypothetical protein KDB73_18900 [Planctomycetes bacterium]|nr:hypothetical protein [Planctomycetota bacterium]
MSLQRLVKLALLALALSLPLLAPSARADDEPTDPRTVVLKTYDVRDLGVTNDELTGLQNDDGTPWKPSQVSMTGGILVVSGSAAEHGVLERWLATRRRAGAPGPGDQRLIEAVIQRVEERLTTARAVVAELDRRIAAKGELAKLHEEQGSKPETSPELFAAQLEIDRLKRAIATVQAEQEELGRALETLRGPDSEKRRRAANELQRRLGPWVWVRTGDRFDPLPEGADLRLVMPDFMRGLDDAVRNQLDRLDAQAAALERQQTELQRRASVVRDLASRLEANEPEKRKSLDSELVRIDRTAAELTAKREALIVQKTRLESALAEKRYDELREQVAKLEAEAREREVSRSSLRTDSDFHELTSYAGRRNSAAEAVSNGEVRMLDELRSLRAEVRELKTLVLKLLEQDGVAVDPRGPR